MSRHFIRLLNGKFAAFDPEQSDSQRWPGVPFTVSGERYQDGQTEEVQVSSLYVDLFLRDGRWICGCLIGGRTGYQPHPLRNDYPALFWEVSPEEALKWFALNHQPPPASLVTQVEPGEPLAPREEPEKSGTPITEAGMDILRTLYESGKRLTTTKLREAMCRVGRHRGESTLKLLLPRFLASRLVDNDPKAKPRGYGLTKVGRSFVEARHSAGNETGT